jgi:hypothetical protein
MNRKRMLVFLLVAAAGYWAVQAGSLEPPGPPAPTMKTLDEIPGTWHRVLGPERFDLVMGGDAVLDHETGLVWQRQPFFSVQEKWLLAVRDCLFAEIGGRKGWRLPRAEELATLVDMSQPAPRLPSGHPFLNLAPNYTYWTQTTAPWEEADGTPDLGKVFIVEFTGGSIYSEDREIDPLIVWMNVWCVRGGAGYDWAGQL